MSVTRGPEEGVCAARECSQTAQVRITWSNPKIPWATSKIWLSCAEHEAFLLDYLLYRGFPFTTVPIADIQD